MAGKKKKLSDRQAKILLFIEERIVKSKAPPSIREICDECKISSTSVADYNLKRLEERGYIRRTQNVARGLEVIDPQGPLLEAMDQVKIGLYGKIAAGDTIPTPDNSPPEYEIEIPRSLLPASQGDGLYALKVDGYSMVDALVADGDIVVLRQASVAEQGDIVAAWIESRDEWTLKKYYHHGNSVELRPCNPTEFTAQDIKERFTFHDDDVRINGVVCLVVRQP
ncbi:MAG: transcriptional repressor LexA [Anaerolineales bacterium]|nr:transcriptional repressor LexA [Anaerolineales bacterium]MCB9128604.1 repressor LexA [Ardenticatenales bacterium]MCB9172542.1 repressor LexA [Ardenticatenales bacterium]